MFKKNAYRFESFQFGNFQFKQRCIMKSFELEKNFFIKYIIDKLNDDKIYDDIIYKGLMESNNFFYSLLAELSNSMRPQRKCI